MRLQVKKINPAIGIPSPLAYRFHWAFFPESNDLPRYLVSLESDGRSTPIGILEKYPNWFRSTRRSDGQRMTYKWRPFDWISYNRIGKHGTISQFKKALLTPNQ